MLKFLHNTGAVIPNQNQEKAYEMIKTIVCPKQYIIIDALCSLSIAELNELLRIFNRLWASFKEAKPIVLQISVLAPAIAESDYFTDVGTKRSWVLDFDAFLNNFVYIWNRKGVHEFCKEAKQKFINHYFLTVSLAVRMYRNLPILHISLARVPR